MSRRTLACATAALSLLLAAEVASAAPTGFSVNRFDPSERGSHWFVLESLDLRGAPRPALGVVLDYAHRPLAIYETDGALRAAIVSHVLTAHAGASLVLGERVRLGVNLPVVLYTEGDQGTLRGVTYDPPERAQSLGDLRLTIDARLFGRHDGPLTMALGARAWLPTGSTDTYSGDGAMRLGPRLLAAGALGHFGWAGQVGVTIRNPETGDFASTPVSHELVYSVAAGVRFMDGRSMIGPELYGATVLSDAFKTRTSPVELLLGGHFGLPGGLRLGVGAGTGVVSGYGAPGLRMVGSFEWSPDVVLDEDGDGVPDKDDACKSVRGLRSADPAKNGCPAAPVVDTDGDDIPDSEDACMDVQGVRTNDPRTNGCTDRDGDGIMDPLDRCPFEAGPRSDDPMKNGCPNRDHDGDGVNDSEDACPEVPGPKTDDPKTTGCPPDPDRDHDGIPNASDGCPDEPGKPDPDPRKNGCPRAFLEGKQIRILDQVKFKKASAAIEAGKDSQEILEAVLAVLQAHPDITKVRVEGHTDNRGDPKANKKLSEARAASVVKWLISKGIDRSRLESAGFGMERPIEANDTEEGRTINRRVEFHIETGGAAPPP